MSVSIFGSSSSKSNNNNNTKNYVDSKFISLIKNVNAKVDKSGDSMNGNLDMGNSKITNLHDPEVNNDAANKKYVDGSDTLVRIYVDQRELVAKTYTVLRETETKIYVNEREAIVRAYIDAQKERTELFVANKYVKNSVGLIPDLITLKKNKSGYIVSASVNAPEAWDVFSSWRGDWTFPSFPVQEERWIKVKCVKLTQIHEFSVRGRESKADMEVGQINRWKFQGSLNDKVWDDLYVGNNESVNWAYKTYPVTSTNKYWYYRFIVLGIAGENLGLNHLQIYSCDPIM